MGRPNNAIKISNDKNFLRIARKEKDESVCSRYRITSAKKSWSDGRSAYRGFS